MDDLAERIKYSLDESRTLILGCQVLTGFQFNFFFQKLSGSIPFSSRVLGLCAVALMLLALAVLMTPSFHHRIVEHGEDTYALNELGTRTLEIALMPLALTIGIDFFIVSRLLLSTVSAIFVGGTAAFAATFFWYGIEHLKRHGLHRRKNMKDKPTPIKDKVDHVLTEARIIIPGAQAILGFQFIAFLGETFQKLPRSSQLIHLGSLGLVALSVILLMTPAAYHREVEGGEATEGFHKIAGRLLLIGSIPLSLGLAGDFYMVLQMVIQSTLPAILLSAGMLAVILGLWFGFPCLSAYFKATP